MSVEMVTAQKVHRYNDQETPNRMGSASREGSGG